VDSRVTDTGNGFDIMSDGRRTILFLNHSASRNGASILLLHLLQWLRANSDFRLVVLSNGGGPLIDDFRAVATTRVWRNPLFFLRALKKPWAMALRSRLEGALLRACFGRRHYDLVYANTAATWNQVAALGLSQGALLWHIHELSYALRLTLGDERARTMLSTAARVVAVSEPVVDSLTRQFAVLPDRVDLVHGFVPLREVTASEHQALRQRILAELEWPADSFVVGACGGLGWRKGSDLFLQIARRLQRSDAAGSLRFLWVGGGGKAETESLQFMHDLQALGLDAVCRRVASTANVDDYYSAMDVFALTSREDPFPLVMLEAAMHGVPTVCFASAGGGPEFVAGDAGIVVPYLDLDAFVGAVDRLRTAPAQRAAFGRAAQRKVRLNHCVETQGPKLLRSIERCLATS
jgi:glycosyltransferase involved in cell wall biosynthesis